MNWVGNDRYLPVEGGEWKKVVCRGCGNKAWCTLEIFIKDGVVIKVQGDPENPFNQGKACARGQSQIMTLYDPHRVQFPVKRTNLTKGFDEDPGWVRITWDEALETVSERLRRIRAEDPRKLIHCRGFGAQYWTIEDQVFMEAFGSPNWLRNHGALCPLHLGVDIVQGGFLDRPDVEHCEYLLTMGGSIGPNIGSAYAMRAFARARERGMKLVVIDPRCGPEASAADEWVPIRPGTDLAMSLAMLSTMLHEIRVFDEDFLKRRTNAVYLVAEDGSYLRDQVTGKPLIWDPVEAAAKTFDDPSVKDFALGGTHTLADGRLGITAFQQVSDEMRQYTPEWAEELTTVPASVIRRLARELVKHARIGEIISIEGSEFPLRPVAIAAYRGTLSKRGGNYQHLVCKMMEMLVGALDVPGSSLAAARGGLLSPDLDGVVEPKNQAVLRPFEPKSCLDVREFYPHGHTSVFLGWRAVLDPSAYGLDYEPEMLINYGANPVMSTCDPADAARALRKIPFVVSISLVYDEITQLADIVLPESSVFERKIAAAVGDMVVCATDDAMRTFRGVLVHHPPIDKVFDTKQGDEIYIELADRAGFLFGEDGLNDRINKDPFLSLAADRKLELHTKYDVGDIHDRMLRSRHGDGHGAAYFADHAVYDEGMNKAEAYNYHHYPMGTTRHPFYFERLLRSGLLLRAALETKGRAIPKQDSSDVWGFYQAVPRWVGRPDDPVATEYDLVAVNWSTPWHRMGCNNQFGNAWIHEFVARTDPYEFCVLMNPATARERGLDDGDEILIEAWHGSHVQGRLKLTELLHPDAVGFPSNHGHYSQQRNPETHRRGPHFNVLLTGREGAFDPLTCAIDLTPRVKVLKIGEAGT